jgi:DNA-binding response OmpR family regulator
MNNRKVLIVEDEEVIRKILRLTLGKWGFEVEEAEDGAQALRKLEKEHYHLIICDIVMPNLNGWDLIKKVREGTKTRDIRIIALTGRNKAADMFKGYELGANYYMTKPFTQAQLQYGIQLALDEPMEPSPAIDLSEEFEKEDS